MPKTLNLIVRVNGAEGELECAVPLTPRQTSIIQNLAVVSKENPLDTEKSLCFLEVDETKQRITAPTQEFKDAHKRPREPKA